MNLKLLFNGLSLTGLALQLAIVGRMYTSDLRSELRIFYGYAVFSVLHNVLLFSVRNYFGFYSSEYFLSYWLLFLIDTTLAFFIIQEIYSKVLYRYEGLRKLSAMVFRWSFMVIALVAAITALGSAAADRDAVYSAILLLDRSAMMVELGLIVLLFVFARSLALGWRECVFGIAVGICFYCGADVAMLSLRAHYGNSVGSLYSIVKPFVTVTTLAIWTIYVYRAERGTINIVKGVNSDLEGWNQAVLQLLRR
jgi:hypothetical protein